MRGSCLDITDPLYLPLKWGGPVCPPLESPRRVCQQSSVFIVFVNAHLDILSLHIPDEPEKSHKFPFEPHLENTVGKEHSFLGLGDDFLFEKSFLDALHIRFCSDWINIVNFL